MINTKFVKITFLIVLFINILFFTKYYSKQEAKLHEQAIQHVASINYHTDDEVKVPDDKVYSELEAKEKISHLLEQVKNDKEKYWLANTEISEPDLTINMKEFLTPDEGELNFANKPTLFYDPRFTLSVYLNEIKNQLQTKNPKNEKTKDHLVTVPFAWSDWVDLTMLNEELNKEESERLDCGWLQSEINKPTKYPNFCKNTRDLTSEELREIGLPSKAFLPGFAVKSSPMNKAPPKQVMMQGKAHLLAYQENPLSIIFLTKNGTYEAQVSGKKRLVHTEMFEHFLERKHINANHIDDMEDQTITLNPIDEFGDLQSAIKPRPLDMNDDMYRMFSITRQKDKNASREIYLDTEAFNYNQEQVDAQIEEYESRLNILDDLMTNELRYDPRQIETNILNRHEMNHYEGLKYSNSISAQDEPTYYKLATLKKDKENRDAGWHYEWRFFNGALRYLKEGYTMRQLEIREQIILDRLLRNWFRFAEEKGIISWIAHGPLLSWYWDGLMFPFDIDIDIQMPSAELNRLSQNYNMTLVVEDVSEGYGKYLIDCATFLHHRDRAAKDNVIDARFIDIDSGTYIDITGLGKNNENPPAEYDTYIRSRQSKGEEVQLYMDRRKHWLNFEKINPLRYSMISGVPAYVPNDIMVMLNYEYDKGTTSYHYDGYYYVPQVRLWLKEEQLTFLFEESAYKDGDKINPDKLTGLIKKMNIDHKVRLLESSDDILIEYYLTQKYTSYHEIEKKFMLNPSLQHSILDLKEKTEYHQLTSKFHMDKPLRKSLFDYEYLERVKHSE